MDIAIASKAGNDEGCSLRAERAKKFLGDLFKAYFTTDQSDRHGMIPETIEFFAWADYFNFSQEFFPELKKSAIERILEDYGMVNFGISPEDKVLIIKTMRTLLVERAQRKRNLSL